MGSIRDTKPYSYGSFHVQKERLKEELKQIGLELSNSEVESITFLSRRKYGRYDHFFPGETFDTRLIKWFVDNFKIEERIIAYNIIKYLKFIDEYELKKLAIVTFENTIKKITNEINYYENNNWYSYLEIIKNKLKTSLSKCIYVACADDIRFDYFRRYAMRLYPNLFQKDNFIEYYKINDKYLMELPEHNRIFLIDQFSGSGTTAIRKEKDKWNGKLPRFIDIWKKYLKGNQIYYCPYIISNIAKNNLKTRLLEWSKKNPRYKINILPTYEITISPCISNDDFNKIDIKKPTAKLSKKYYSKFIENEHTRLVGGVPYGYGNSGLTLIFQTNCPNNSLPLIWHKYNEWYPLFPRVSHHR